MLSYILQSKNLCDRKVKSCIMPIRKNTVIVCFICHYYFFTLSVSTYVKKCKNERNSRYSLANWKSTDKWLLTCSWKFSISTICNFAVIYPWNLLFSKKVAKFLLSFLFVSKILQLNNLKTRTAMMRQFKCLLPVLRGSYIYYITCMTLPVIPFLMVARLNVC